jgi:hypothetical protein
MADVRDAPDARDSRADAAAGVRMPDFVTPTRGFRHTADTALEWLRRAGVPWDRVVLRAAAQPESGGLWVVAQDPPPATALRGRHARVVLTVDAPGTLTSLPRPFRERTQGAGFTAGHLAEVFDHALQWTGHRVRGGNRPYALGPDAASAALWLRELLGVDPAPWPPALWPALARALLALPRVGGSLDGLASVLDRGLGLSLLRARVVRRDVPVDRRRTCRLGAERSHAGADLVLGGRVAWPCVLELTFAVPDAATARLWATPERTRWREALYPLLLPAELELPPAERWRVTADAFRLGAASLGLTSSLQPNG